MGTFDKAMLSLCAVLLTVVSLGTLLTTVGYQGPSIFLARVLATPGGRTAVGAASALFFLGGIRFIYFAVRRVPGQALVQDSDMGEVRISVAAVNSLVTRVVLRTPGVREARVRVHLPKDRTGIIVTLEVKTLMDSNVPELSEKIQKATIAYVRDIIGVSVLSVRVSVLDIVMERR